MEEADRLRERVITMVLSVSGAGLSSADVSDATTLRGDLGMNSLQAVTLVLDLEELLDITIEEEALVSMGTVGDILRLVRERMAGSEGHRP